MSAKAVDTEPSSVAYVAAFNELTPVGRAPARDMIRKVTCLVLIVAGKEDPVVPSRRRVNWRAYFAGLAAP